MSVAFVTCYGNVGDSFVSGGSCGHPSDSMDCVYGCGILFPLYLIW